jgi:hypothetical protein
MLRMVPVDFEFLINLIVPNIAKKNTTCRAAVPVEETLAVTLRFLATNNSHNSLQYFFRISKEAIGQIILEAHRLR